MESNADDAERLRTRQADADNQATRRPDAVGLGAPCRVGKIVTGGGSTGVKSYEVQAHDVTGDETEGTTGTLTDAGWSFFATNLGATAPAVNAVVLCTLVDYRWVFRT